MFVHNPKMNLSIFHISQLLRDARKAFHFYATSIPLSLLIIELLVPPWPRQSRAESKRYESMMRGKRTNEREIQKCVYVYCDDSIDFM